MTGFQNPYLNPYGVMQNYQTQPQVQSQQPVVQVVKVNGENGARSYQMGANSSALLLDESGLMVWLVTSDGAGYKTVTPYDITPHQTAPSQDITNLENRIKRLEEKMDEYARNTATVGKVKSDDAIRKADDRYGQQRTKPASYAKSTYYEQSTDETDY